MASVSKSRTNKKVNKKNLKLNFAETMDNLKKIKNFDTFKSALDVKLFNPTFQAHFFSSPNLFKLNFRKKTSIRTKSNLLQELHISIVAINKNKNLINRFSIIRINFERFVFV